METISMVEEISDLMSAHGVPFHVKDEWVVPFGKLPAIRANYWFMSERIGRLNVDVLLEDQRIIYEAFAGLGAGEKGINDALQNFCFNSFHVLLAALWETNVPELVTIERWSLRGGEYTAYIGNFGIREGAGVSTEIPDGLFGVIEKAIHSEVLEHSISWFRCFFGWIAGSQTFEALKDNEEWESGLSALRSLNWVKTSGYYSVRCFCVVKQNA